jgi:phosphoesterase RecJ-like protein
MPLPVPQELIQFIKEGSRFIVAGHKEPDGDCVGSQLALCGALQRLGKEAVPCSAGPFKRTEITALADRFCAEPNDEQKTNAKVILVDCSGLERSGELESHLRELPLAIIDHHATGEGLRSSAKAPVYLDAGAPSATLLVLALIEALGMELAKAEAEYLLFGLCTDTGFFRHLDETGAETFYAAAKMVAAGANPKKTFQVINGGKSLNSRILLGHILSGVESCFDGKLLIGFETWEDHNRFGLEGRDSDALYQLLQSVAGVESIAIIRQEKADSSHKSGDKCSVGLRSRNEVDVAAVAASFGGGGHKNASGFSIEGTISNVRQKIVDAFNNTFTYNSKMQ